MPRVDSVLAAIIIIGYGIGRFGGTDRRALIFVLVALILIIAMRILRQQKWQLKLTRMTEAIVPTRYRLGVDVGGTHTDLVLNDIENGAVRIENLSSSPSPSSWSSPKARFLRVEKANSTCSVSIPSKS